MNNEQMDKPYQLLYSYLAKASKTMAWKDIMAVVARVHRDHRPDSWYTSQDFFNPKVKK